MLPHSKSPSIKPVPTNCAKMQVSEQVTTEVGSKMVGTLSRRLHKLADGYWHPTKKEQFNIS